MPQPCLILALWRKPVAMLAYQIAFHIHGQKYLSWRTSSRKGQPRRLQYRDAYGVTAAMRPQPRSETDRAADRGRIRRGPSPSGRARCMRSQEVQSSQSPCRLAPTVCLRFNSNQECGYTVPPILLPLSHVPRPRRGGWPRPHGRSTPSKDPQCLGTSSQGSKQGELHGKTQGPCNSAQRGGSAWSESFLGIAIPTAKESKV